MHFWFKTPKNNAAKTTPSSNCNSNKSQFTQTMSNPNGQIVYQQRMQHIPKFQIILTVRSTNIGVKPETDLKLESYCSTYISPCWTVNSSSPPFRTLITLSSTAYSNFSFIQRWYEAKIAAALTGRRKQILLFSSKEFSPVTETNQENPFGEYVVTTKANTILKNKLDPTVWKL